MGGGAQVDIYETDYKLRERERERERERNDGIGSISACQLLTDWLRSVMFYEEVGAAGRGVWGGGGVGRTQVNIYESVYKKRQGGRAAS